MRYAIIGAAVIATVLAGCSSAKETKTADTTRSAASNPAAAADNSPKAHVDLPPNAVKGADGSATITLGGQISSLTGPVDCRFRGDSHSYFVIEIGDDGGGEVGSYLSKPSAPEVEYVNIRDVRGITVLAKGDGSNGNVTVTKKPGGYVLTGWGTGLKEGGGMDYHLEFTVDVTCPEGWDRS